jgi:RimJ/RimL family protein N-acetyltransferase
VSGVASVRVAVVADAPRLHRLRRRVFGETEFMLWEPDEFDEAVADEERRIARMNEQPNSRCFVAVADDDVVGFLNAMGGQPRRLRYATSLALGVARPYWGQGVGSALLSATLAWSQEAGLRRVDLTVQVGNVRAIALYERFGFVVEGVRRSSLVVGGHGVDELLMSVVHAVDDPLMRPAASPR